MEQVSDCPGNLFSHVAAVYRPGERDMAVEFVEALGCVAADTPAKADSGRAFMSVHPNPDDRDPLNNVFYLSQMMPQQLALEQALRAPWARTAPSHSSIPISSPPMSAGSARSSSFRAGRANSPCHSRPRAITGLGNAL